MLSVIFTAGTGGLTTEEWNDGAREAGLGLNRKADLYDLRETLKGKRLVTKYGDKWVASR